jgi:hypothetical protein
VSKYAKKAKPPKVSPITATAGPAVTAEGAVGAARDPKSELFLLAVSNMGGEDTFYESAKKRDARFASLVAQVTASDPTWVAGFVTYLRDSMQMRTASVVMAAEYARAKGPGARLVVANACLRPDEPAELLGYWIGKYGKRLPQPVKRGLADAVRRLYTERAALKYDNARADIRMGDVIEMVHPKPSAPWQSELFKYLIDRRHNRELPPRIGPLLNVIAVDAHLQSTAPDGRRARLGAAGPEYLAGAGMTWERLSGWLPGGMDKMAWETVIPTMGVMALLRNLRNFDEAGVSDEVAAQVIAKLNDPVEVRKARVFPLRFFSALKAVSSLRWHGAMEKGVRLTLGNIPELKGRTLVMVDNSGSMADKLSERSSVTRAQVAGLFGAAIAQRNPGSVAVSYDSNCLRVVEHQPGAAVLPCAEALGQALGGTATFSCTLAAYKKLGPFDRIVILTDEQRGIYDKTDWFSASEVPCPIYTFNLAGHAIAQAVSDGSHLTFGGGLTDSAFLLLAEIERVGEGNWPWMQKELIG